MEGKFSVEIKEHIAVIGEGTKGWKKELNIVSWNGREPKYDIRDWDAEHENCGKGIGLTKEEAKKLYEALSKI